MHRRHAFSLLMSSVGVALLVAATTVGAASSATRTISSSKGLHGGTLRVVQAGRFGTLDPGLAYTPNEWQVLYSTQLLLVNFPSKAGSAGEQLVPEAARALPTVSKNGMVFTFHLRSGLKFDDGAKVSAAAFQRAWERVLSPKMYAQYGTFDRLNTMVAGAAAFTSGKAAHISGIKARGLTLTFRLTKPNPAFLSILATPWFGAVKPNMPYSKQPGGISVYPSAGPYYIAANQDRHRIVLKRNPYYRGGRPANPDQIVIHGYGGSSSEAVLLRVERNQADYDLSGVPADDVQAVAQKYGYPANRHSQFRVGTQACIVLQVLNNAKPPTDDARVREAINYAIGRSPIVSSLGPYAGTPTGQMLVPGIPGYKKLNVYGNDSNVEKAKQVGGSALQNAAPLDIYYYAASQFQTDTAELEQSELQQIGLTVNLVKSDPTNFYGALEQKGNKQWNLAYAGSVCPDQPDPSNYINALLEGRLPYAFANPSLTRKMDHAASLSGEARAGAYAALDRLVMTKYAPVFPLYVPNFRYLTSRRVHNVVFSHYYGGPLLNAMSVR